MTITRSTGELTREAQDWGNARDGVFLDYFTGIKPASADMAVTGYTKLVTFSVDGNYTGAGDGFSFGTAVAGVISRDLTQNVIGTAVASGTVGWARMREYADTGLLSTTAIREDYSVGLPGSGADIIIDDVLIEKDKIYPMGSLAKTCSNT